ncbi:hypothetical protein [Nitrosopumilus sp.]|uniref:hypothetical protein n=1 Tax=Nitrosopumilus sp. TaxID=2024843 RepID=UPI00247EB185|nr:hypothetical protein [Nitrosopumilus sp.]MCV0411171.1 hypothetical protein [Nitrosopumilus sp.]
MLELKNSPKRFKDLLKSTKFSPTGLTKILKELVSENKIQKTLHEGKEAYSLSKKQSRDFDDLFNVAHTINSIIGKGGKYYRFHSGLEDILQNPKSSLGIESNLTLDKELDKLDLLSSKDIDEIRKIVLKKIVHNIKTQKLNKKQTGELVLSFVIDYPMLFDALSLTPKKVAKGIAKFVQEKYDKIPENAKQRKPSKEIIKLLRKKK